VRNAKPVSIVAAVALATILCGILALKLTGFNQKPPKAEPPKSPLESQGLVVSRDVPTRDPVATPPQQGGQPPDADSKPPRVVHPVPAASGSLADSPDAGSKNPRVVHLKGWLPEILSKAPAPEKWLDVVDLNDPQSPVPQPAVLELLTPKELGLKSDRSADGTEIRITTGEDGSVAMRLEGQKLEMRFQSNPSDALLHRLQWSVLGISSKQEGHHASERPVRVVFTPVLSAVPFSSSWEIEPSLLDGAKKFFIATDHLKELQAKVRIDAVSLSILPRENEGWLVSTRAENALGRPLAFDWPGTTWYAKLKVETYFDREDKKDHSAIEAQLTSLSSTTGASGKAGERNDLHSNVGQQPKNGEPAPATPKEDKAHRQPPKGGPASDKKTQTEKKEPAPSGRSTPATGTVAPVADEISPDRLKKVNDRVLLSELFRRYGQVHGAIVVSVASPGSDKDVDVEVLRFGNAPKKSNP